MHIVGIGNPVFDYIKTPKVDTQTRILSGCSTNACLAVSKLGAHATLIGCIGQDFAPMLEENLKRYGINGHTYPSEETGGFSLIYYDELGNRTLDVLGCAQPLEHAPTDVIASADFVLLGPVLGEIALPLVEQVRPHARQILLDPQGLLRRIGAGGRVEHYRSAEIDAIIPLCDVVKANEVEAEIITGVHPRTNEAALEEATRRLHALGTPTAIVTLAAEGSAVFDGQTYTRIPAFKTAAVDPTGAGDTYAGGFMFKRLEGGSVVEACYYGACTSSVMVENVGPDFPLTKAEADRRLALLSK